MFTKMHLHHVNNQNHHKQLIVPSTRPWKYFRTIDCETPQVGLSSNRSLPFKANGNDFSIIASLDGLVCVGIDLLRHSWGTHSSWCRYLDIILWNPLTGDYKTLSKDISHANCFRIPARGYGLYYSRSDDDYKLLRVTESVDAYIYSLKSNSWRKMDGDGELTKVASLCLQLGMHEFYKPLHLMKNGNWLAESRIEGYVDEVDLVRKTTKEVCRYSSDGPMEIIWRGKFVEMIVSLSRLQMVIMLGDAIVLFYRTCRALQVSNGTYRFGYLAGLYTLSQYQIPNPEVPPGIRRPASTGSKEMRTETANCDKMSIIASLNGLVCVGIDSLQQPGSDRYEDIVLWNPLTGDYKTLPKDSSHDNSFTIPARGYGFYYSSCDDDYKLLRITQSTNAYIYSLKSDSWRQVESASCCLLKYLNTTCLLNENLYFLVQCRNNMNVLSYSIVRFDTNAEKFTEIATPSFDYVAISYYSLRVVSGRIHLWVGLKGVNCWDLWNMDEDGEWTKDGSRKKVDLNYHTMRIKKVCTSSNMEILRRGNFVESIVSLK
ncbi:hypothetical protein OSB04_028557, partial [Centaurea solstitialis]